MSIKTMDKSGGINEFDQVLAMVIERPRNLSSDKNLPNAFLVALPSTHEDGQAAVELVTCIPESPEVERQFAQMTINCLSDWAGDLIARIEERDD